LIKNPQPFAINRFPYIQPTGDDVEISPGAKSVIDRSVASNPK
jgi:hypothetical protein